jgi:hypothetical protein
MTDILSIKINRYKLNEVKSRVVPGTQDNINLEKYPDKKTQVPQ